MAAPKTAKERREQAARNRRERELNDIRSLLGRREGRRLLWRIFERAHLFETTFTGDGIGGAFKEGERNVGLFVFSELMEGAPERFQEMMNESSIDAKKEKETDKEDPDEHTE